MDTNLVRHFGEADVRLTLLGGPLRNGNRDIFQMDVLASKVRDRECIRIWPGDRKNQLTVPSVDRSRRQLVLFVQEPVRKFTVKVDRVRFRDGRYLPAVLSPGEKVLGKTDTYWEVERRTDGSLRRFLCGMDETHLFVAQFAAGETVADAHAALRPPEVDGAERRAPGETVRQGEWFFIPLEAGEREALEAYLRRTPRAIRNRAPVGAGQKPHVADQVVLREVVGGWTGRRWRRAVGLLRAYARGSVRHPDHASLHLDSWRRVVRNQEVTASRVGDNGVYWID
jgi:hypothetical protein